MFKRIKIFFVTIMKTIFIRIFCHHEWEFQSNWSMHKKNSKFRTHQITVVCSKCHKIKHLPAYKKEE